MIIRAEAGRLRLIDQAAHALVAGEIARAWGRPPFSTPTPAEPVIFATAIHDAGWREWDARPYLRPETQRPYDFIHIPSDDHVEIYERSVDAALAADPYAGLLVSMHGAGFYRKRYGHMPKLEFRAVLPHMQAIVDGFLERQRLLQERLIAELQPDMATLWTHYRWLQGWDALAVYLGIDNPVDGRTYSLGVMPHFPGGPEAELWMTGVGPSTYVISPWPFEAPQLDVMLPARYCPDRPYATREEFLDAFASAPVEPLHLALRPGLPAASHEA